MGAFLDLVAPADLQGPPAAYERCWLAFSELAELSLPKEWPLAINGSLAFVHPVLRFLACLPDKVPLHVLKVPQEFCKDHVTKEGLLRLSSAQTSECKLKWGSARRNE